MTMSTSRMWAAAACLASALATQPATASVVFNNITDTFGLNYDISAGINGGYTRTNFFAQANFGGSSLAGLNAEIFSGLNGGGSSVFSGTLAAMTLPDFTDAGMLDGIFSVVVTFTGAQLPESAGPGSPRSLTLDLRVRGFDSIDRGLAYENERSTFQPAPPVTASVPEPGTLGITALAGALMLATSRRRAARA